MVEWEYKIVELTQDGLFGDSQPTEADLNELGGQGWELAAALTVSRTGITGRPSGRTNRLVFKRSK